LPKFAKNGGLNKNKKLIIGQNAGRVSAEWQKEGTIIYSIEIV